MWSIFQTDDGWAVRRGDDVIATVQTHDEAMQALSEQLAADMAEVAPIPGKGPGEYVGEDAAGMLPERWRGMIAYSAVTESDGRDFTACVWSWRDPATYPLPLMLQTENEPGHDGATWSGTIDMIQADASGQVFAGGGFMDTDEGRKARDMLVAAKRLGVSVDPGAIEYEDTCTAVDDDGFCVDGFTKFLAYEILGLTITPFPAFAQAYIEIDTGVAAAPAPAEEPVVAASAPAHPPRAWFEDPQLKVSTPLSISEDGRVFGLVADFNTCHVAHQGRCVTAPDQVALSVIHTGTVVCEDGTEVATGPLVWHANHAPLNLAAAAAVDHYAHTGMAWADCRFGVTPGVGIWCAGAVRPEFMDDVSLRSLRASALSGDWRAIDGRLQLVAVLSVNSPGFPIPRAVVASNTPHPHEEATRFRVKDDALVAAVGLGRVAQVCSDCEKRRADMDDVMDALRAIQLTLTAHGSALLTLDRRTKPMATVAAREARKGLAKRVEGRPAPDAMPALARLKRG